MWQATPGHRQRRCRGICLGCDQTKETCREKTNLPKMGNCGHEENVNVARRADTRFPRKEEGLCAWLAPLTPDSSLGQFIRMEVIEPLGLSVTHAAEIL